MEKRNFTRVPFSEGASIRYNGQVIWGKIKDVSLQGMFINIQQEIPNIRPVQVTAYLSSKSSFKLQANVVRYESTGLGLQITEIDAHSFKNLRNIIAQKCNDQDTIMRETYKMVSCIL